MYISKNVLMTFIILKKLKNLVILVCTEFLLYKENNFKWISAVFNKLK